MRYAVLGPVLVEGADGPRRIDGTLRRTLLATLLLHPGEVLSADHLAEVLWGERPRVSATASLYNQVMRLRQTLGPHGGGIRAVPPGYVIDVEPGELDTDVFARHRAAAEQAARDHDWATSAREYGAALALWRGEPLADVPALQPTAAIEQLREERILAQQGRIEADLHLARHDEVVGELRALIEADPWREAFHGQLMLALYRAGRRSEALEVHRDLRRGLAVEFGVEPGEGVRDLHARILRSDPALALPPASTASAAPTAPAVRTAAVGPVPLPARAPVRQLPADTRAFTGREAQLRALIGAASPTVVISAISGMGGVGKTALAVRAAHRLAERYPDGQLFIDLYGHSADLNPIAPEEALDFLLRAIGVEPKAIPAQLQERAALYRSRLAGTRTLIVLDNARSPAQVKPLIPAEPGCLVLVTSRSRLAGLDDAETLSLDALAVDEAVALLAQAAGPGRVDEADPATLALIQHCGRLPLALRIVGARLRQRPMLSAASLLAALNADADPLALLKDDDRDLTRVFASSLDVQPEERRRLFALLGIVPGPDFDAYTAAALQDTGVAEAERQLDALLDHSLLIQHAPGRYRLHDLLRAYARVRAHERDPQEVEAAHRRLLDYYLETATLANGLWCQTPAEQHIVPSRPCWLTSRADASAWFGAERESLLAVFVHDGLGPDRRLQFAADIGPQLRACGPWQQALEVLTRAAELTRAAGDRAVKRRVLRELGNLYGDLGRLPEARLALEQGLAICREAADQAGEVNILRSLAWTFTSTDVPLALRYCRQATELARETGNLVEEREILNVRCIIANQLGRFDETIELCERLLALSEPLGASRTIGGACLHISHALYALGRFDEVEPTLFRALTAAEGSINGVANVELQLGRLRMRRGQYAEATVHLQRALQGFVALSFTVGTAYAYGELGRIRFWEGDPDGAMTLWETALRYAADGGNLYVESFVRPNIGYAFIARGDYAAAEGELGSALESSVRGGFMYCQAEAKVGMCALVYARDGAPAALAPYRETLAFVRAGRHPCEEAAALVGLGRCERETGENESGLAHLGEAIGLYTRMGSARDVAATKAYLV